MDTKFFLIGNGFLGHRIISSIKKKQIKILFSSHLMNKNENNFVDITKKDSIRKCITKFNPDVVINCAANRNIDFLEENPKIAFSINSNGVKNLAEICKEENKKLIHISTDNVFDGNTGNYDENSKTNPVNIYGQSKELAEKYVMEILQNYIIIRTNFFGIESQQNDLISGILKTIKSGEKFHGFNDIVYSPLEIDNLSDMIAELSTSNFTGIIHLSSNEHITKYDFACRVAETFGFKKNLIVKSDVKQFNLKALRPKNTSLSNNLSTKILKTPINSINDSLKKIKMEIK